MSWITKRFEMGKLYVFLSIWFNGLLSITKASERLKTFTEIQKTIYWVLGGIYSQVPGRTREVVIPLFSAPVRRHLCVKFWGPHYKKEIDVL